MSAFGLSNNNKLRCLMWTVAAHRSSHWPSELAWSVGQQPPSAECVFMRLTTRILAMALVAMVMMTSA